jgi:hypothetical protein
VELQASEEEAKELLLVVEGLPEVVLRRLGSQVRFLRVQAL